jgi:hypothetical protein
MADDQVLSKPDEELLEALFSLLQVRSQGASAYSEDGSYAALIRTLPVGLRAMAATHWLDLSLTLEDLGSHFLNFGEEGLVKETILGFRELGLLEFEAPFVEAFNLIQPIRNEVNVDNFDDYLETHGQSLRIQELNARIQELNARAGEFVKQCDQVGDSAIYGAWIKYTREHPENVFDS